MTHLTDWYPQHIKPVRVGVYKTLTDGHVGFSYWNGSRWGGQWFSVDKAAANHTHRDAVQSKVWCGVDRATIPRQVIQTLAGTIADRLTAEYGAHWGDLDKRAVVLDVLLGQHDARYRLAQELARGLLQEL